MTPYGPNRISDSTVRRLSKYYRTLAYFLERGVKTVSSEVLAEHNGVTAAQVRKDLSCFGAFGRRGLGYNVPELKRNIARIMGLSRTWRLALVGVGNVGRALLDYDQFQAQGFNFLLAFDSDPNKIGKLVSGLTIHGSEFIEQHVRSERIEIGVVAVPARFAQGVVDKLVTGGVCGILNFAPINITAPPGVYIRHESMAIEMEALAFMITNPELAHHRK